MNRLPLLLIVSLALAAGGCDGVKGDGKPRTESRQVKSFTEVDAAGAFRLLLGIGEAGPLQLSGDANLLPLVVTRVEGGRLKLSTTSSVRPSLPLQVKLTTPELARVAISGASNVNARGLTGARFRLEISGAGEVELAGKVERLEIVISGAGKVQAARLVTKTASVVGSGAGKVELHASESLDVKLSGVGKVLYHGDPKKVTRKISGMGKLIKK